MNEPSMPIRAVRLRLLIPLDRNGPGAQPGRLVEAVADAGTFESFDPVLSALFVGSGGSEGVRRFVRPDSVRSRKLFVSTGEDQAFATLDDVFVLATRGKAEVAVLMLDFAWTKLPPDVDALLRCVAGLRTRAGNYAVELHERSETEEVSGLEPTGALLGRGRYGFADVVGWLLHGSGWAVRPGGSHPHLVAADVECESAQGADLALRLARGVEPGQRLPQSPSWARVLDLRADRTAVVTRSGAASVCWGNDGEHVTRFVSGGYFWSAACVHLERLGLARMSSVVGDSLRAVEDVGEAGPSVVDESLNLASQFLRVAVALSIEDPGGEQEVGEFHRAMRDVYANREMLAELREEVRELVQIADARTSSAQGKADRESAERERTFERRVAGIGAVGVALAWFTGTLGMNVPTEWTAADVPKYLTYIAWLLVTGALGAVVVAIWKGQDSTRS